MNSGAVFAVALVVCGMAVILYLQHLSEKQGIDTRAWRMFWVIVLIAAAFGIYLTMAKQ